LAICDPKDLSNLPYIKYGRENENKVAQLYVDKMHNEGNTQLKIKEVGLCVNPSLPHLGASLDRMVHDPQSESKFGGLEVKTCPKAGSLGLSVMDTIWHSSFKSGHFQIHKGNSVILNPRHIYSYQVQGQLALTALEWVDFVAYSGVGDIFVQRISFDKQLWLNTMLPRLNSFYFSYVAPFLLTKLKCNKI
jgi:hypothetical protein